MQIGLDLVVGPTVNVISVLTSLLVGVYLISLWYRQENRMYTDLPFNFGLAFLFSIANALFIILDSSGILVETLDVFRVRSFTVWMSVFPMGIILLNIWFARFVHRHKQILGLWAVYVTGICLFGPTKQFIMIANMIPMLVVIIGLVAVFAITWKTNRLEEVRSDLMVISMLLMIASQFTLVVLQSQGLAFVAHVIRAFSTILAGIGLANPWYHGEPELSEEKPPLLSRINLLHLSLILLPIFYIVRDLDIYVYNIDATPFNVMPSKIISTLIILTIFWFYRRESMETILGLGKKNLRSSIALGLLFGFSVFMVVDIFSSVIYVTFVDPSIALTFATVVTPPFLLYNLALFFINAVFEETFFRGMTYHGFKNRFDTNIGILASVVIFGMWHIAWPIQDWIQTGVFPVTDAVVKVVFSGILGFVFNVWYVKGTEESSLIGPIIAHTLINYLNEGFKVATDTVVEGPDLSFFSPVHMIIGLVLTLALFGVFILYFWKRSSITIDSVLTFLGREREEIESTEQKEAPTITVSHKNPRDTE